MNSKDVGEALEVLEQMKGEASRFVGMYSKSRTSEDADKFVEAYGSYLKLQDAIRFVRESAKDLRELAKEA